MRDESGSTAIENGLIALLLTMAIVGVADAVGSYVDGQFRVVVEVERSVVHGQATPPQEGGNIGMTSTAGDPGQ